VATWRSNAPGAALSAHSPACGRLQCDSKRGDRDAAHAGPARGTRHSHDPTSGPASLALRENGWEPGEGLTAEIKTLTDKLRRAASDIAWEARAAAAARRRHDLWLLVVGLAFGLLLGAYVWRAVPGTAGRRSGFGRPTASAYTQRVGCGRSISTLLRCGPVSQPPWERRTLLTQDQAEPYCRLPGAYEPRRHSALRGTGCSRCMLTARDR
jgi:hypothetical protein